MAKAMKARKPRKPHKARKARKPAKAKKPKKAKVAAKPKKATVKRAVTTKSKRTHQAHFKTRFGPRHKTSTKAARRIVRKAYVTRIGGRSVH